MSRSPFKTPEFNKLFNQWNKILEDSGHVEIEDFTRSEVPLKTWHATKWHSDQAYGIEITKEYYAAALNVLNTFQFESKAQKRIWALHCEGVAVRKIVKRIRYKTRKSRVHKIIDNISKQAGLKKDDRHD